MSSLHKFAKHPILVTLTSAAFFLVGVSLVGAESVPEQTFQIDPAGLCENPAVRVPMNQVLIGRSKVFEIEQGTIVKRYEILDDTVVFSNSASPKLQTRVDVAALLTRFPSRKFDVEFAMFRGELMIYWREAIENREYHQGLFRIEGAALKPLCEGVGGMTVFQH